MAARIYKPAQTAMQSGPARTKEWVLEYEPEAPREIDPLMGWTSSGDMKSQISLAFDTQQEAIAYAERNGIPYSVAEPTPRRPVRRASATATRQANSNSARSIHSPTVCASFWPAPNVTVGMPWRTIQLASRPPLVTRTLGMLPCAATAATARCTTGAVSFRRKR